jgi:hypothetical protein
VWFYLGIRRGLGRGSTSRAQRLRGAWTWGLAIGGSTALAECGTTGLSAVVATVLFSGTSLLSLETVAEVPFELYQHHLIVTKGSIGPLKGLSLLIDTGTIPSMVASESLASYTCRLNHPCLSGSAKAWRLRARS